TYYKGLRLRMAAYAESQKEQGTAVNSGGIRVRGHAQAQALLAIAAREQRPTRTTEPIVPALGALAARLAEARRYRHLRAEDLLPDRPHHPEPEDAGRDGDQRAGEVGGADHLERRRQEDEA